MLGVTGQTSYPSEWHGALSLNRGYIVLHLAGQRRLLGWAEEWPSSSSDGHFVMMQPEWLNDKNESQVLSGVDKILIRAADVEMIEMMTITTKEREVLTNGGSQSTNTTTAETTTN